MLLKGMKGQYTDNLQHPCTNSTHNTAYNSLIH